MFNLLLYTAEMEGPGYSRVEGEDLVSIVCVCVCVYIFIKLHITAQSGLVILVIVCVCVFFPFILDIKFVGRTSRGHTRGRSHGISHPPSFCGACLNFSREKDSAIPFPRRP